MPCGETRHWECRRGRPHEPAPAFFGDFATDYDARLVGELPVDQDGKATGGFGTADHEERRAAVPDRPDSSQLARSASGSSTTE